MNTPENDKTVLQTLCWGPYFQQRASMPDTQFVTTGRRIYVMGDIDGRFRSRSNPYDLHTFGAPRPDDPLAEKLQGVWAQPVKGFRSYGYQVEWGGERWALDEAETFIQSYASVRFEFQRADLFAERLDFADPGRPLMYSRLTLRNQGAEPVDLVVRFRAEFELVDAWFTHLAEQRSQGERLTVEDDCLVARSAALPEQWAAAARSLEPSGEARLLEGSAGEIVYSLRLEPGAEAAHVFGLSIASQGGAAEALALLGQGLPRHAEALVENQQRYERLLAEGPAFVSPDPALNAAFDLARANLQLLEAESPALGRYFYAGLEIFPFWFSNDGAYSTVGLLASGLREPAENHIRIGLRYLGEGRVPHQISPAGNVAFAGNAEETPLWVRSIWDTYRWTGSRDFLAEMFPGASKGLFDYVLGKIDPDSDGYPSGPGMVEVEGMGAEKLDSAAYTLSALSALAFMADVLLRYKLSKEASWLNENIQLRFDGDWWYEPSGTYAMSLDDQNKRYHMPHWAVVVPLEAGVAEHDHAARTFATLRAQYLNRWGLKHTVGDDERVWTLPTALLSRAAFTYHEKELGFEMLRHVAETLDHGSIGLFHELIPEGACIVQLWSAALYVRGVIEDLLGIHVEAGEDRIRIVPRLPAGWDSVSLNRLRFGQHCVDIHCEGGAITVAHCEGSAPLDVECRLPSGHLRLVIVPSGKSIRIE